PPCGDALAVIAAAHVVTVGALPGAALADPEGAVVAAALMEAGVPVASRVVLDEDEAALERALTPDDGLTVVIAGGGSAGDVARGAVASPRWRASSTAWRRPSAPRWATTATAVTRSRSRSSLAGSCASAG